MATNRSEGSQLSGSEQSLEQAWNEYRQFWLDAIAYFREEGLITDEVLRRHPKLRTKLRQARPKRTPGLSGPADSLEKNVG